MPRSSSGASEPERNEPKAGSGKRQEKVGTAGKPARSLILDDFWPERRSALAFQSPIFRKLPIAGMLRMAVPASQIQSEVAVESSLAPMKRS